MATRPTQALRARDIDRAVVATALDNAYADGQLTFDEHRDRIEKARAAQTLGQLHALAADLQAEVPLPEPRSQPPARGRRGPVLLGAALVIAVLAIAVFFGIRGSDTAPPSPTTNGTARPIATADGTVVPIVARPFDFVTAEGLTDFRDRYLARFGDPIVAELYLNPADNRATLTRLVDGDRTRGVTVRGGFDEDSDTDLLGAGEATFDIGQIDVGTMAGLMAGAASYVEVPGATVTQVIVRNLGTPEILIYAADADGRGGYFETTLAGDVVGVWPYRP